MIPLGIHIVMVLVASCQFHLIVVLMDTMALTQVISEIDTNSAYILLSVAVDYLSDFIQYTCYCHISKTLKACFCSKGRIKFKRQYLMKM